MKIRHSLWLAPIVALAVAGPLTAQTAPSADGQGTAAPADQTARPAVAADTVVATVDGEEITAGQLALVRSQLPAQYQQIPDDALYPGLLDQVIQQIVLAHQTKEPDARTLAALENEKRAVLASAELENVVSAAVTDEAVQAAYDANYANAEPTREWNAAHILVKTEEEAKELKKQADEGTDFTELAKANSTGPSGPNGGELGWFSEGMMVPEFEEAVKGMEPGQVSEPVQTQFGWHVIKLTETRMKDAPKIDEVRDDLIAEIQQKAVQERLDELTGGAEVTKKDATELDTSFLSNPDLFN
jgi:peptidyl-prolyl cis-trans isomerase C